MGLEPHEHACIRAPEQQATVSISRIIVHHPCAGQSSLKRRKHDVAICIPAEGTPHVAYDVIMDAIETVPGQITMVGCKHNSVGFKMVAIVRAL